MMGVGCVTQAGESDQAGNAPAAILTVEVVVLGSGPATPCRVPGPGGAMF